MLGDVYSMLDIWLLIILLKNYMLIIIECEISLLLLENVALRMGNLQVIKKSC